MPEWTPLRWTCLAPHPRSNPTLALRASPRFQWGCGGYSNATIALRSLFELDRHLSIGMVYEREPMAPSFPRKFSWHMTHFSMTTGTGVAMRR